MSIQNDCARELLAVAPLVVSVVRAHMRDQGPGDLTVTQFRALAFVDHHSGASLSDLADHLGLQLPSASKLVDGLVEQELLTRERFPGDRRCVSLVATARGRALSAAQLAFAEKYLEGRLASLDEAEQIEVLRSLQILRPCFTGQRQLDGRAAQLPAEDAADYGQLAPEKTPAQE